MSRASEALEVVAGRGWLWEWWPSGAGDQGWRRSKMGSWPGRRAAISVRTTAGPGLRDPSELRAGELRLRRLGVEGEKVEKRLKDTPTGTLAWASGAGAGE